MIRVPAPESLEGAELQRELETAGYVNVSVVVDMGEVVVTGQTESGAELGERNEKKVASIVKAHGPKAKKRQGERDAERAATADRMAALRADAQSTDPVALQRAVAALFDEVFREVS